MKNDQIKKSRYILGAMLSVLLVVGRVEAESLAVLELFTSQGCSSCPSADAILKKLSSKDAHLLPLSFQVDYWDDLGWKDPFSSTNGTSRQRLYAKALSEGQVFTPQLIVNRMNSVVGSEEGKVEEAIRSAKKNTYPFEVSITETDNPGEFKARVARSKEFSSKVLNSDAIKSILVRYTTRSQNTVTAGENGGKVLEHLNNVLSST